MLPPHYAPRGSSPQSSDHPPPSSSEARNAPASALPQPARTLPGPKKPAPFALPNRLPPSFSQARPVDILSLIPAPYAFPAVQLALRVVASVLDPLLHSTSDPPAHLQARRLHVGFVPPPFAPAFCGYATFALSREALSRLLYLLTLVWEAAFRFSQTCEALTPSAPPSAPSRGRRGPPRPPAEALQQLEADLAGVATEAERPLSQATAVDLGDIKKAVHICRYAGRHCQKELLLASSRRAESLKFFVFFSLRPYSSVPVLAHRLEDVCKYYARENQPRWLSLLEKADWDDPDLTDDQDTIACLQFCSVIGPSTTAARSKSKSSASKSSGPDSDSAGTIVRYRIDVSQRLPPELVAFTPAVDFASASDRATLEKGGEIADSAAQPVAPSSSAKRKPVTLSCRLVSLPGVTASVKSMYWPAGARAQTGAAAPDTVGYIDVAFSRGAKLKLAEVQHAAEMRRLAQLRRSGRAADPAKDADPAPPLFPSVASLVPFDGIYSGDLDAAVHRPASQLLFELHNRLVSVVNGDSNGESKTDAPAPASLGPKDLFGGSTPATSPQAAGAAAARIDYHESMVPPVLAAYLLGIPPRCIHLRHLNMWIPGTAPLLPSAQSRSLADRLSAFLREARDAAILETRTLRSSRERRRAGGLDAAAHPLQQCIGRVALVQGPPGTGKTTTLARVARSLIGDSGLRLGVTSNTHNSIDGLVARILNADAEHAGAGDGCASPPGASSSTSPRSRVRGLRSGAMTEAVLRHRVQLRTAGFTGINKEDADVIASPSAARAAASTVVSAAVLSRAVSGVREPSAVPSVPESDTGDAVDVSSDDSSGLAGVVASLASASATNALADPWSGPRPKRTRKLTISLSPRSPGTGREQPSSTPSLLSPERASPISQPAPSTPGGPSSPTASPALGSPPASASLVVDGECGGLVDARAEDVWRMFKHFQGTPTGHSQSQPSTFAVSPADSSHPFLRGRINLIAGANPLGLCTTSRDCDTAGLPCLTTPLRFFCLRIQGRRGCLQTRRRRTFQGQPGALPMPAALEPLGSLTGCWLTRRASCL